MSAALIDQIDPYIPWENAAPVLAEALKELIAIEAGKAPDDDAIDAHRQAVRSLAPLDLGFDPSESAGDDAEDAADAADGERAEDAEDADTDETSTADADSAEPDEDAGTPPATEAPWTEFRPEATEVMDRPSAEILAVFRNEARELLAGCESGLLSLENDPTDSAAVSDIFRAMHSFKGNCGFVGYRSMEQLTHRAESLLVLLKEGRRPVDEPTISALMSVLDALNATVDDTADDPQIPNIAALIAELDKRIGGPAAEPSKAAAPKKASKAPKVAAPVSPVAPIQDAAPAQDATAPPSDTPELTPASDTREAEANARAGRPRTETTLRVDVAKVEALLDLMGELIIAGTAVRHLPIAGPEAESFARASAQLDRVVRSLQDVSMSLRMVPVGPTFRKMVRLVRDVSLRVGKPVELVMDGEETEIDKSVAELIADPLVHLVRNAIDHGLEAPDARAAANKPRVGRIRLSGAQVGGEVWIRVEDDGRGLDRQRILDRAIERGLVDATTATTLSDSDAFAFIFEPGFSTAAQVTDVSGRGVGMDVVARNIAQVKGRVDIRSNPGHGAVFTLRIPLTLAIIEGMLLRVGHDSFTVPLLNIRESVVIRPQDVTTLSSGQELVRIRGELLPVLRIHRVFEIAPESEELHKGIILVVEDGGAPLCLFVDQLVGQRQTVIKAVSGYLGNVRGIAGCTVLGDGRISLVLDIGALIQRASLAA